MTHPNEVLLREAFAAFQRGDLEALRTKYFAEDIRYHVSGQNLISGDYEGVAQVLGLFGHLFELSGGTLRIQLHDVVASDEHSVALFALSAERDGRRLDDNEILVAHPTPDGKAAEVWTVSTNSAVSDEFWS